MSTASDDDLLFKVLVVGASCTGKTSIVRRWGNQGFRDHYQATIGVDFAFKIVPWDPLTNVRLQLWDIAGQDRFAAMTRTYYRNASGALVVFDASRGQTFDEVMKWKDDLDEKVRLDSGLPVPCVLLANKADLPKEGLVSCPGRLSEWARQQGFAAWFETSAKQDIGIDEAVGFLLGEMMRAVKAGRRARSAAAAAEAVDVDRCTARRVLLAKCC